MRGLDAGRADDPVAARAATVLDEVDEGAPDTRAAMAAGGGEHPELARVGGDVAHADAAGDLAAPGGDRDLTGGDQVGDLRRVRPPRALVPEAALGGALGAAADPP